MADRGLPTPSPGSFSLLQTQNGARKSCVFVNARYGSAHQKFARKENCSTRGRFSCVVTTPKLEVPWVKPG